MTIDWCHAMVPISGQRVWMYRVVWKGGYFRGEPFTYCREMDVRACDLQEWEAFGVDVGEPEFPFREEFEGWVALVGRQGQGQ